MVKIQKKLKDRYHKLTLFKVCVLFSKMIKDKGL